jgi:hypothetical protein
LYYDVSGDSYYIDLTHNGPVVLGATITFKAVLYNSYGENPSGNFEFVWRDNGIPKHSHDVSFYLICKRFLYVLCIITFFTTYAVLTLKFYSKTKNSFGDFIFYPRGFLLN